MERETRSFTAQPQPTFQLLAEEVRRLGQDDLGGKEYMGKETEGMEVLPDTLEVERVAVG